MTDVCVSVRYSSAADIFHSNSLARPPRRCMWKHLPHFGHRRTNSRRGTARDRSTRARANTIQVAPDEINPTPRAEIIHEHSPSAFPEQSPSPPSDTAALGPTSHRLMTTATVDETAHAPLPPSKASLRTWWNHFAFTQRAKREAEEKKGTGKL